MLDTPMGKLKVLFNSNEIDYVATPLPLRDKRFVVDARFRIDIPIEKTLNPQTVCCCIDLSNPESVVRGPNLGELIASVSFYAGAMKLNIGTTDEIPDFKYQYVDNGITITISPNFEGGHLVFGVAWFHMIDEDTQDSNTWYASDPSYF